MDLRRIQIAPSEIPAPEDYEAELQTVNKILDLCEANQIDSATAEPESFGKLSAWVAYQLATIAGEMAGGSKQELSQAFAMAAIGVKIAFNVRSPSQIYNSLLAWGYVLMRVGNEKEGESVYLDIIDSPLPGGVNEKAFAHISLGGILSSRGQPSGNKDVMREAVYHYERGLRYVRGSISANDHIAMLEQLVQLYAKLADIAGLSYCAAHLGNGGIEAILKKHVKPDESIEDILSLNTRLHALGEHRLADIVFQTWRQLRSGASKPE